MIQRPSNYQHVFTAAITLFSLISAEVYAIDADDALLSDGNNLNQNNNEREHRKHKRRRSSKNIVLPQQQSSPTLEKSGVGAHAESSESYDIRNKYRVDNSLRDENRVGDDRNHDQGHSNKAMPDLRIINGKSAPETRYPYSASLQYNRQHFCGGSLVAPDIVITAAHCTSTPTKITLGRYDLDSETDDDYEILDVKDIIIHPNYDQTVVENDIALLVLDVESIHPYAKLNANAFVPSDGEELAVMGWGDIDPSDYGQMTSDELRETGVWYLTNNKCEESEGYVKTSDGVLFGSYQGSIRESMMCAHDRIGTTSDACQGDSGGALVKTGSDSNSDILVGLVSWGFGCADPNFPGVYSRLSSYYDDFLRPIICEYSRSPPSYLNCNVSGNPTSPVSNPDGLLTVFIETDPFSPEDLGWELTSVPGGEIIEGRPVGYYASKYQTSLSEEVVVTPENFYRFTIFDRDSDGFRGEVTVVRGRTFAKSSDALVNEPGFSSVSGGSVVHGFYVGDNPPRELTLDLTFDNNPGDLAWSVTNVEDDLPLGFRWFDSYGTDLTTAREKIPIYGNDRGQQKYIFTVLDLDGDGMCCLQGQGSFSLHLGDSSSGSLIATGGQFTTDQSFTFEINSAGLVTSSAPPNSGSLQSPTKYPTSLPGPVTQSGYYMASSTGICQLNDESRPAWNIQVFTGYDECCQFSWNKQQCLSAMPGENVDPPIAIGLPANEPAEFSPIQPADVSPIQPADVSPAYTGGGNTDGGTLTFTPVTGSFTCKTAGMFCTIKCYQCGSIKRVASGMSMEYPNKSTIMYTAEVGTDDFPEEPSRLVLVESDSSAMNVISCDEGCTCNSVNDNVLGCGLVAEPATVQSKPTVPSPPQPPENLNCSLRMDLSIFLVPSMLLFWVMWR